MSTHPGLTERQRASIDIGVTTVPDDGHFGTPDIRCRTVPHRDHLAPEPGSSPRWARSVPLLRRRAACDAQLPAELVAILSCPRLPVPRIVALLDDPELVEAAAANPALPVDQMQRIIESNDR